MEDFPLKQIPRDINWSENYALAGFDPAIGVGVFLHIGRWRKDLELWREIVSIILPDGSVVAARTIGAALANDGGPGSAHLRVDIVEDGRRQRWSFLGAAVRQPIDQLKSRLLSDGPLERFEFGLDFVSDLPVWQLGAAKQSGFAGHGHVEQIGRVTGVIKVANQSFSVNTLMNRDHSRGPRLMNSLARHVWCQGIFSDGRIFMAYEAQERRLGKSTFAECCTIANGNLTNAKLELGFQLPETDGMEHIHDPVPFRVHSESGCMQGEVVHFPTTMYHQFTYPWDSYLGARQIGGPPVRRMVEQAALYKLDDGITGYGHMERTVPGRLLNDHELSGP